MAEDFSFSTAMRGRKIVIKLGHKNFRSFKVLISGIGAKRIKRRMEFSCID